jgi:hypothetical protein
MNPLSSDAIEMLYRACVYLNKTYGWEASSDARDVLITLYYSHR